MSEIYLYMIQGYLGLSEKTWRNVALARWPGCKKRKGVKKFSPSPHDDERDKLKRKQRQWELFPQDESLEVGRKDFAKMYIKTKGNRRIGAMALLDSGADLSLMTLKYLKTLCSDDEVRDMTRFAICWAKESPILSPWQVTAITNSTLLAGFA